MTADVLNKESAVRGPGNEKKGLGRKMDDPEFTLVHIYSYTTSKN